ncbi:MAG: ABC transporter ATP-binding protein [Persicimonas sp.]
MPDTPRLQIKNLTKRYRRLVAVDDFSMTVNAGEFVGFIGPNGAGKSTTMGCVAGVLAPDEGSITVADVDVVEQPVAARAEIGFVPQELELYDYLTGEEFLRFVAEVRGVDKDVQDEEIEALLELTELDDARHRVVKEYSGGMTRKIAICAALIGSPPLLLLDEAFVGLDPESTFRIRKWLESYCDDGGAIVLSSHILDMLERLCSRIVIMVDGELGRDMSREELDSLLESGDYPDLNAIYLEAAGKTVE